MFWPYIRLFRNLSVLQHVVVFLTTFMIPVSFELEQGLARRWDLPVMRELGKSWPCIFGWYQIAMLVIA